MRHSYKLARTHRNVAGMSCGPRTHIVELVQVSNKLVEDRKNLLIFRHEYRGHVVWNSKDSFDQNSGDTTRGHLWRYVASYNSAKSSHIMDKLVYVRQGLWNTPIKADLLLAILKTGLFDYFGSRLTKV